MPELMEMMEEIVKHRPPELMEEIVEEVLLRFPSEDPASLVRAALVSKRWCRLVSGRGFRRRFREFHRAPPLLGLLCNRADDARCIPTCSFRPPRRAPRPAGRPLRELPVVPLALRTWNAAVLCAAGDRCDHLDCHRDPFLVVLVGTFHHWTLPCVYSSETDTWSGTNFASYVLVGGAIYFKCHKERRILNYDLATAEMSKIRLPKGAGEGVVLMATKDGRLGFAIHGPDDGDAGWERSRVIELGALLPYGAILPQVAGFAETGGGVIFIWTGAGFFSIDLKSGRSKEVGESCGFDRSVVPYMSFSTPGTDLIGF
uniref:F-box domain-containing protein n=1 Tax=Setaria italica TaxID=4555 RepID=K3YYA8_SETIT